VLTAQLAQPDLVLQVLQVPKAEQVLLALMVQQDQQVLQELAELVLLGHKVLQVKAPLVPQDN
jgi:hypothetical protein